MVDRIGGDEDRHFHVAVLLVDLIELAVSTWYRRRDHEAILGQ